MERVAESWEPIHQRLMQEFWGAIQANVERVERKGPQYDINPPEGFPEGSKQFFENFAHALVRVQMEGILRNMVDAAMTSVAKELAKRPEA
jgi:truncated hemoglobin YjbI